MNPPTLVSLPTELLENISLYVSQYDLAQCVRVSRSWATALTPYLWQTIGPLTAQQRVLFSSKDTQQALARNSVFVRTLHLDDHDLYDLLLPARTTLTPDAGIASLTDDSTISLFTNLRSLNLEFTEFPQKFDQKIVELVQRNPSIRHLAVRCYIAPETLICLICKHLPDLEDFCFDPPSPWNYWNTADTSQEFVWRGDVRMVLQNLPESIRTVTLNNVQHMAPDADKMSDLLSDHDVTRVRRHRGLRSLSVDGYFDGREAEVLVPFLESCSANLQSVAGLHSAFLTHPEIVHALEKIGFTWKELDNFNMYLPDQVMADIISGNPQWTRFHLHTMTVGPPVAAAIVNNCANLEQLELYNSAYEAPGITGSHMQMVLAKAPRLNLLVAHWLIHDNMITASDILSSEWATTSLEHIDFKISVPRADNDAPPDSPAVTHSRSIQRQILRRLGQQKSFRKLLIGGMIVLSHSEIYDHQRNCLEMTLESGLDELAGLKDLEELDIHHMDHRVGVPELEWMAKNFPKLRRLNGMYDSLEPPSQEVQSWLENNRPDWGQ
ncbi:hypothetical protein BGZ73_001496 [Actinomortierella ambigua]|nr:hypothetical protein BGZ73_001496 [Actinomortierella ambigua]